MELHQQHPMSPTVRIPVEYQQTLNELNREVLAAQPNDILQFCANFFHRKLEEQRTQFLSEDPSAHRLKRPRDVIESSSSDKAEKSSRRVRHYRADSRGSREGSFSSNGIGIVFSPPPGYRMDEEVIYEDQDHLMESDEDFDHEEGDDVAELPHIEVPVNYNRGRRTSVSAESMAPSREPNQEKKVFAKTDEQKRRIEMSILNNFLFRNLDEDQHRDVINAMVESPMVAGQVIIRQGAEGDFFYVVESGTLDVFISKNGQEIKVTSYEAGGSFGELALMYGAPRAATVLATSDGVLWALDRVTFRQILMENTDSKRRMYEKFLEEVTLLKSLEPYERHKIADALESVVFQDGDVVIKQGDVGKAFFLIESGEAVVTKIEDDGTEREVNYLGKGGYFGELALLNDKPRAATVTAKGRLKLATLGKKAFTRLLGPVMEILKRNSENYAHIMAVAQHQNGEEEA